MDLSKPEKIVCVGDFLTSDILFGNINKMATIWVTKFMSILEKGNYKKYDNFRYEYNVSKRMLK